MNPSERTASPDPVADLLPTLRALPLVRRPTTPDRMARTVGALGWVLLLAAMVVLVVVGFHAARLGRDPAFLFDCDDFNQCEDLWLDARTHYRMVTLIAALAAAAGWFLAGTGRTAPVPSTPPMDARHPRSPRRRGVDAPAVLAALGGGLLTATAAGFATAMMGSGHPGLPGTDALAGVVATALVSVTLLLIVVPRCQAGWVLLVAIPLLDMLALLLGVLALPQSLNLVGAVLVGSATAAAVLGRRFLDVHGRGARDAHRLAGTVAATTAAVGLLGVLPLLVAWTSAWPIGVILTCAALVWRGLWFRSLARTSDGATSSAPVEAEAPPRVLWSVLAPGAVAIALLAVWAAWPVPAPPADATPPDNVVPPPTPAPAPVPGTASADPTRDPQARPTPVAVPPDMPACAPEQLTLQVTGFDSAMGKSGAGIRAANTGSQPCALRGRPVITIVQGGDPIDLRPVPMDDRTGEVPAADLAREDPDSGAVLAPGGTATAGLFWPGYRDAADQTTPQSVSVALTVGGPPIPAPITGDGTVSGSPGPAPFDLKDGVPGGAELRVGAWTPST